MILHKYKCFWQLAIWTERSYQFVSPSSAQQICPALSQLHRCVSHASLLGTLDLSVRSPKMYGHFQIYIMARLAFLHQDIDRPALQLHAVCLRLKRVLLSMRKATYNFFCLGNTVHVTVIAIFSIMLYYISEIAVQVYLGLCVLRDVLYCEKFANR